MSIIGQQGALIIEMTQVLMFWEDSNILTIINHCTRSKITLEDPGPRKKYFDTEMTHITFAQNSLVKTSPMFLSSQSRRALS